MPHYHVEGSVVECSYTPQSLQALVKQPQNSLDTAASR
jgi:hypothetical protein